MKTECSMVITADFLISNVRTCQKEDRWCDALSLLHEGLMGSTYEQCIEIMKGNYGLEGDSSTGMFLFEEEPSIAKEVEEIYVLKFFYENNTVFRFKKCYQYPHVRAMLEENNLHKDELYELLMQEVYGNDLLIEIDENTYIIATRTESCVIPFWYEKTLFAQSGKEYYELFFPEEMKYKTLEESVLIKCAEQQVDWKEYTVERTNKEKITYKVPVQVAVAYLNKSSEFWKPVSKPGEKMNGDCPFHTDLWAALGHRIDEWNYESTNDKVNDFYDLVDMIKHDYIESSDFTVLVSAKLSKFTGKIVFVNSAKITDKDILILPNANVKYESQALKAGLVIVETGSALSHLVMLNKNIEVAPLCILRMKDAITKFKDCASLKIDFEKKTIIGRYHA